MKEMKKSVEFNINLILWHYNDNKRLMPWKGEKNPYNIWLSEIILQQTRVEQGLEYYNKFIIKYPNIKKLALAPEDEVFKLWEGLGYYSRCKNLIATARFVAFDLGGEFPKEYENILKLKGIGPYTAAAIASFAYNLPYAVVDGNVLRVLARFFGKSIPIDSNDGKKYFASLAQELLSKDIPAVYNQAIMDFGATVCKPKNPLCVTCTLKTDCIAFKKKLATTLPIKESKLVKKNRFFYYIIVEMGDKLYVKKRTAKDIWQNLWEFILIEQPEKISVQELKKTAEYKNLIGKEGSVKHISTFYKQQLTHQTIEGIFIHIHKKRTLESDLFVLVNKKQLSKLAFPRFITNYFEHNAVVDK
jgi:A/G-specific adenine glycosylase